MSGVHFETSGLIVQKLEYYDLSLKFFSVPYRRAGNKQKYW